MWYERSFSTLQLRSSVFSPADTLNFIRFSNMTNHPDHQSSQATAGGSGGDDPNQEKRGPDNRHTVTTQKRHASLFLNH